MQAFEHTPLQWKKHNNKNKCKMGLAICICIMVFLIIGTAAYFGVSFPNPSNKANFEEERYDGIHVKPAYPADIPLPSADILEEYRSNIKSITYSIEQLKTNGVTDLRPMSAEIQTFHSNLIAENGLDSSYNIQFTITNNIGKCVTEYTESYTSGFIQIKCSNDNAIVTGCTSYRPSSNGYRFAEGSKYLSECYTNAQFDGYTRLSARCCTGLVASTLTDYGNSNMEYCLKQDCTDPTETVVGCSAHAHSPLTNAYAGVKLSSTGCQAQRSDDGYFWVKPYCVTNVDINCYTVEAMDYNYIDDIGVYESRIACDERNGMKYEMTDCNSYIQQDITSCSYDKATTWGQNLGGWIQENECVAHATLPDTIAQATCCSYN
eukprot:214701_1